LVLFMSLAMTHNYFFFFTCKEGHISPHSQKNQKQQWITLVEKHNSTINIAYLLVSTVITFTFQTRWDNFRTATLVKIVIKDNVLVLEVMEKSWKKRNWEGRVRESGIDCQVAPSMLLCCVAEVTEALFFLMMDTHLKDPCLSMSVTLTFPFGSNSLFLCRIYHMPGFLNLLNL
jgi:hypothetical protein